MHGQAAARACPAPRIADSFARSEPCGRAHRTAYAFLAPYLLIFLAFWVWPIINSFLLSFLQHADAPWTLPPRVNWGRLLGDPAFFNALKNTLIILVIQVPIMIALATVLAVLLNSPAAEGRGLFRFAFFAPVVVGEVAYCRGVPADVQRRFGIVNKLLAGVGLAASRWFSNPTAAMALIIMAVTWRWAGYNAIIILAGLQSIPEDVYEAATLDGVSKAQAVLLHHAAAAEARHPVLRRAFDHRHHAALHRAVPDHQPRRARRQATETLGLFLYRQGFTVAQFRLRLGGRLHHRRAGGRDLARSTCGWGGSAQ